MGYTPELLPFKSWREVGAEVSRRPLEDIFSEEIRAHRTHHLCWVWPLLNAWLSPATESYDAYREDELHAR